MKNKIKKVKSAKKSKKLAKKIKPAKKVSRATKNEITIKVQTVSAPVAVKESDLIPEKQGGKYMLTASWLSEKQALQMLQRTDPKHIYRRKGKGDQEFDYVTGIYVTKALNFTFGWNWDFEIIGHGKEDNQVWVQGKLTVKDSKGNFITKSQFGRADIKTFRATGKAVDFGNDLKAASTDALKKCASLLGIASDVYGKAEFKEVNVDVQPDRPIAPAIGAPKVHHETVVEQELFECHGAGKAGCPDGADISKQEREFSMKVYGKPLCRNCQKIAAENKKR